MKGTVTISIEEYEEIKSLKDVFEKKYEYVEIQKGWRPTGSNSMETYSEGFYTKVEKGELIDKILGAVYELSKENKRLLSELNKTADELLRFEKEPSKRRFRHGGWFG